MGKTNKAQRTKGNAKPSSSSHSAQLLSLSGKTINGFIGFGDLEKDKASYVPATGQQISEACDSCVDSDFRMVMRKMLKRDAVTKLKALQEFKDFCSEKDFEAVKNVLPFWPRLFNRLALDTDRRIREATHLANGELISKIKKEIAPYLKSIMGVWLLGQCDLYAPAASAAQATFAATFPSAKQSDAIIHCKTEIFSYFKDNLFEQTAKSLSEPNSASPEDIENKYILVVSGTFQAFKFFLNAVHRNEVSKLHEDFYSIVTEKKFWKFAKSNEPEIRGSWYALVSSLCQVLPGIFSEMENKLATIVFSCLAESDPVVAPSVWESALSIVVNFENCWQGININKVVLPQLWSLLKEGGKGNAQVLFPCLLPFLSKLPLEIVGNEEIMLQFFRYLKLSLYLNNVRASHMECDAILTAFIECLQYICCVRLDDMNFSSSLLEKVLKNDVLELISSSLDTETHLATSKLYPLTGSLICKLEYKCLKTKETFNAFAKVLDLFWENILQFSCEIFSLQGQKKIESVMYISYFYNSILAPSDTLMKTEKSKVRFEDEAVEPEPDNLNIRTVDPYSTILSNKKAQSFSQILKFSKLLCEKINEKFDLHFLNLLVEILGSASTNELLVELITSMTNEKKSDIFYQIFVSKWINQANDNYQAISCIAEFIFLLCTDAPDEEAKKILHCVPEAESAVLLHCLLSKGFSKYASYPPFHQWVRDTSFITNVAHLLSQTLKKILHCNSTPKIFLDSILEVLKICMKADLFESNEFSCSTHLKHILKSLKDFAEELFILKVPENESKCSLEFFCDVGTCILKNSHVCWSFRETTDLIFIIFHHTLTTENSCESLKNLWVTAVECYIQEKSEIISGNSLILKMASDLHSSILHLKNLNESTNVLDHCFKLLSTVQDSLSLQKSELQYSAQFSLSKLNETILPTDEEWQVLKEDLNFSTSTLFLKKKLFYPLLIEENFFPANNLQNRFLTVFAITKIIITQFQTNDYLEDKELLNSFVIQHFPHVLWFATYYEETSMADVLDEELKSVKISKDCFEMLTHLPNIMKEVISKIVTETLTHGCFWAVPLQFIIKSLEQAETKQIYEILEEHISRNDVLKNVNYYILLQLLIPHLSMEKQLHNLDLALNELVSLSDFLNDDFAAKLGEVNCYLHNCELPLPVDKHCFVDGIACKVIKNNLADKKLEFSLRLLATTMFYSVVKDKNCNLNETTYSLLTFLSETVKNYFQKRFTTKLVNPKSVLEVNQIFEIFTTMSNICSSSNASVDTKKSLAVNDELYTNVVSLYLYVANEFNEMKPLPEICSYVLMSASEAMTFLPPESLVKMIDKSTEIPRIKHNSILQSLVFSLTFSDRQIQFTSHSVIMKLMRSLPDMVLNCENFQSDEDKEEDVEKIPNCLSPLIKLLTFLTEIIDSMLLDFKIGDLCSVLPGTDSYVYTMAYLLAWIEMLEFISSSPSQVRSSYSAQLEESKLLSQLFNNVCRLMPGNPIVCILKDSEYNSPKKEDLKVLFTRLPVLNLDQSSSEDIQSIACYVYATVLRKVPASIRTWWNNLDRKSSDIVNKFTTKYISGLLCVEEIQAVHESEKDFENMVVQARPGSREVISTYTIDDTSIELSVQLPVNHPLGPISVERKSKLVIGQLEWRHWLMQLTTLLRYQNGSILDGLKVWKRNLDKKFEGVEECMICYYVLHSSTSKLPKLSCRVCKKKFHSACLIYDGPSLDLCYKLNV